MRTVGYYTVPGPGDRLVHKIDFSWYANDECCPQFLFFLIRLLSKVFHSHVVKVEPRCSITPLFICRRVDICTSQPAPPSPASSSKTRAPCHAYFHRRIQVPCLTQAIFRARSASIISLLLSPVLVSTSVSYTALPVLYFIDVIVRDRVELIYWARGENSLHNVVRNLFFNARMIPLQSPYLMRLGLGLLRV